MVVVGIKAVYRMTCSQQYLGHSLCSINSVLGIILLLPSPPPVSWLDSGQAGLRIHGSEPRQQRESWLEVDGTDRLVAGSKATAYSRWAAGGRGSAELRRAR